MNNDKLTKKDVFNQLRDGRDFELEHLWQRSVFLGAFLILFFTVYFTVLGSVFSAVKDVAVNQYDISAESTMIGTSLTVSEKELSEDLDVMKYLRDNMGLNFALFIIALLGAGFSLLWIFMAKGSKYWYEKYEKSIDEMQEDDDLFDESINKKKCIEEVKAKLEHREVHQIPIHGHMPSKDNIDSIFSHKGGKYSLSGINVSIGHIFYLFWFLVCTFHIYLLLDSRLDGWLLGVISVILSVMLFVFITLCLGNNNKSGEANWSNVFRVFWSISDLRKMLKFKISRKRNEITNFVKLIEDSDLKSISIKIQSDDISLKDKKWKVVRKNLENNETREYFLSYFEEKIFSTMKPEALQGNWTEKTGRTLTFTKNDVYDEGAFLKIIKDYFYPTLGNSPNYRVFTSIPWEQLKVKYNNRKRLQGGLDNATKWQVYYILCDDINNVICYERFDFYHSPDRERLNSVLVNHDGEKLKEYVWWKVNMGTRDEVQD